ncbi:hypothetical protein B0H13DRAFT_1879902 [Mycena leptocephala]|nr:hypothetical protein B0H13DRAFT_1879902 [Mycena leptocephala]
MRLVTVDEMLPQATRQPRSRLSVVADFKQSGHSKIAAKSKNRSSDELEWMQAGNRVKAEEKGYIIHDERLEETELEIRETGTGPETHERVVTFGNGSPRGGSDWNSKCSIAYGLMSEYCSMWNATSKTRSDTASVNMIDSNISSSNNGVSATAKSETHLSMATPRTLAVSEICSTTEHGRSSQRSRPGQALLDEGKQNPGGDDKVGPEAGICLKERVDATGH